MSGDQQKFLLMSANWNKVWFIVPKKGLVTVDWAFTGHKQHLSKASARQLWNDLKACGFKRIV